MTREAPGSGGAFALPFVDRGAADEIDLLGIARTLWRGKWVIALAAGLAFAVGWYQANVVAVPQYTARVVVAMETRDENVLDLGGVVTGLPGTLGTINTELGVIRSRGLIEKLVDELGLASDPEFNPEFNPGARAPQGAAATGTAGSATGAASGAGTVLRGWLAGLKQRVLPVAAPAAGADPAVAAAVADERRTDRMINAVLARLTVWNDRESYLFNISLTTTDPVKSAALANTLARLYIEDQIEVKYRATEQATAWLSGRLQILQADLQAAERAVEAFTSENRIVRPEDLEAMNLRIDDARERLAAVRATERELRRRQAELARARAAGDGARLAALAADATLDRLRADGADPAAVAAREAAVVARAGVELDRSVSQGATLAQSIAVLREDYARQSDNLVAYQQLDREVAASRAIYEYFLGRLKELSAQQGNLRADSRIISRAAIPGAPSAPRRSRIEALALLIGLVAGAAGVLLWDRLHTGFRTAEDLEAATGRTVLGQIPVVPRQGREAILSYFVEKPTSMAAEAVRNLRTSVLLSNVDKPPRVIMLTSSLPAEGKTTTAIALAQNFTGLGKRVLLIEGDIRHRVFREYLGLKKTRGLLAVVSGELELAEAVERSYLIDADVLIGERAAMNAADVFSSSRFKALLAEARSRYDVVIIDTPPVLVVPDARVIAPLADAVIYTVHWDRTARRDVATGLRMLNDGGGRVTGLALARIDLRKLRRYGSYAGYGTYGAYKKYGHAYYND